MLSIASQLLAAIAWVLLVEAMAFAGLGAFAVLSAGPLRAAHLAPARILVLFGAALVVWLGRSDPAAAALSSLALATMAAFALRSRAPAPAPAAARAHSTLADWLLAEACFLVPFAIFLALRGFLPDLTSAEKFPDFAIFQTMPAAHSFPAPDPWLAGRSLNYYSFGHLALALPGNWLGIPPEVAYSIAVAFIGGAGFSGFASLFRDLTGRWGWGVLGGYLLAFAGNLDGLRQLAAHRGIRQFDYWQSSRVIPNAIDEFPFFSLLHGDLHAHVIALLPQILMLTACARLVARPRSGPRAAGRPLLVAAFAFGTGWIVNPWDAPVLAALLFGSLLIAGWHGDLASPPIVAGTRAAFTGLVALGLGFALYLPFHLSYRQPIQGVRLYHGATPGDAYLIHVLPLFLPVAVLLASRSLARALRADEGRDRAAALASGGLLVGILVLLATRRPVLAVNLPFLVLALAAAFDPRARLWLPALFFSIALFFLSLCEVVYVKDSYAAPLERMNTVFKAYSAIWPLLAAAATLAVHRLNREATRPLGLLVLGLALALVPATLVYPLLAPESAMARTGHRGWSLDGLGHFARSQADEYVAIQWLREARRACPESVILEATGDAYSMHARFSVYSGIPTVLGWANHEMVWRGKEGTEEILKRREDVSRIYESSDAGLVGRLLDRYRVSLIAIGSVERADYPADSLSALALRLPQAFRSGDVTILAVPERRCP